MDRNLKSYETWWEDNFQNKLSDMKKWFGDGNEEHRKYPRKLIKKMRYISILDGGGLMRRVLWVSKRLSFN